MKALILSFVEPDGQWRGGIKRAQCLLPTKSIGTPGVKIFFKAGGTWQPHVNSTSLFFQPKTAEYKGFLLKYYLFRYKHCFLPNFELKDFPDLTSTPCTYLVWHAVQCGRPHSAIIKRILFDKDNNAPSAWCRPCGLKARRR